MATDTDTGAGPERLENGMLFAYRKSISHVSYCAVSVKSGTRDEHGFPGGIAHFAEHLIFKGTATRSASAINSCLEKLGGELNAYTSKEETVLHATVLREDLPKAIDLLTDLAFCATFPEKEIEKERTVVIEEINSYKDSPADQIFDDFEEELMEGTPLSMPVLGKARTLKQIDRNALLSYYRSHFIPENMCLTVISDADRRTVERYIKRAFGRHGVSAASPAGHTAPYRRIPAAGEGHFLRTVHRRSHQCHCIIGGRSYSCYDGRRYAMILLMNILGGPAANSRLNVVLRERNALVYSVEASYSQFEDTGEFTIYFGCDRENLEKCVSLVKKEFARFSEAPVPPSALRAAKKQLLGQITVASDNGEAQVLSMGKNLMLFGRIFSFGEMKKLVEDVTPEEIQNAARESFREDNLSMLRYV